MMRFLNKKKAEQDPSKAIAQQRKKSFITLSEFIKLFNEPLDKRKEFLSPKLYFHTHYTPNFGGHLFTATSTTVRFTNSLEELDFYNFQYSQLPDSDFDREEYKAVAYFKQTKQLKRNQFASYSGYFYENQIDSIFEELKNLKFEIVSDIPESYLDYLFFKSDQKIYKSKEDDSEIYFNVMLSPLRKVWLYENGIYKILLIKRLLYKNVEEWSIDIFK